MLQTDVCMHVRSMQLQRFSYFYLFHIHFLKLGY